MTRLTDVERRERAVTEADFQRQVTDLATALGWSWAHWRALQNRRGMWQVPVEGPLGAGWPDLTLLRVRDRRLLFVELKRELGQVSADQAAVLHALELLAVAPGHALWRVPVTNPSLLQVSPTSIQVAVWRPSMLRDPIESSPIYAVLR